MKNDEIDTLLNTFKYSSAEGEKILIEKFNLNILSDIDTLRVLRFLRDQRLFDAANSAFVAFDKTKITTGIYIESSEIAFHQGDFELALRRLSFIPDNEHDKIEYILAAYRSGIRSSHYKPFLILIENASVAHPDDPWVQFFHAESAIYSGHPAAFIQRSLKSIQKWPQHQFFINALVRHTFANKQWYLATLFDTIRLQFYPNQSRQQRHEVDPILDAVLSTPLCTGDSYSDISSRYMRRLHDAAMEHHRTAPASDGPPEPLGAVNLVAEFLIFLEQEDFSAALPVLEKISQGFRDILLSPVSGAALVSATRYQIASTFNNGRNLSPTVLKIANVSIELLTLALETTPQMFPLYRHEFVGILHELATGMLWFGDQSEIDLFKEKIAHILLLLKTPDWTSGFGGLYQPAIKMQRKRLAVLLSGQIRGTTTAPDSIVAALEGSDADIFLTCWDQSGFKMPTAEVGLAPLSRHVPDNLLMCLMEKKMSNQDSVRLFNSLTHFRNLFSCVLDEAGLAQRFSARKVYIEIERHFEEKYGATVTRRADIYGAVAENTTAINSVKMIYMIEKSFQNLLTYEATSGYKYDIIARIRPDFIFSNNFKFLDYLSKASKSNSIFLNAFNFNVPSDMIAIGCRSSMAAYHTSFTEWLDQEQPDFGAVPAPSSPHSRLRDLMLQKSIGFSLLPHCTVGFDGNYNLPIHSIVHALRKDLEAPHIGTDQRTLIESMLNTLTI